MSILSLGNYINIAKISVPDIASNASNSLTATIFGFLVSFGALIFGLLLIIFSRKIGETIYQGDSNPLNVFPIIEALFIKRKAQNSSGEPGLLFFIWWFRIIGIVAIAGFVFFVFLVITSC
jgi:hypothetical protein